MNLLYRLARAIGLAATPVFASLAAANLILSPSAMQMPAEGGVTAALPSMWLMYALMAVAHLPPWLDERAGHGVHRSIVQKEEKHDD